MAKRHITKAKNHYFKDDDLAQVLHSSDEENIYSKTKGGFLMIRAHSVRKLNTHAFSDHAFSQNTLQSSSPWAQPVNQ